MRIVLANGCFRILHFGHVEHLRAARGMGDLLIVALTLDGYINKPGGAINTWNDRAGVLQELRCVDSVIPSLSAVSVILQVKPDIFCKGIDYAGGDRFSEDVHAACAAVGAEIRYTTTEKMSATDIIRRVRGN